MPKRYPPDGPIKYPAPPYGGFAKKGKPIDPSDKYAKKVITEIFQPTVIAKANSTRVCKVTGTGGISILILADKADWP